MFEVDEDTGLIYLSVCHTVRSDFSVYCLNYITSVEWVQHEFIGVELRLRGPENERAKYITGLDFKSR